jgi:ABC-type branched-subunit amino acid transport system substrate-binding protein
MCKSNLEQTFHAFGFVLGEDDGRKGAQMTGVMMFALRRLSLTMVVLAAFTLVACWGFSRGAPAEGSVVLQVKVGATDPSCTGKPLQFTSILSLTGPLSVPSISTETKHATAAALKAVNSQCALGRPIAVDLCDDKSDPNAAQQCGLKAKSNGSLALFGSSGTFTNGTNAAQLPGIFTAGGTVFDLTNPNSFSSTSGLTLVLGGAGVAAGLHKKENLLVVVDTAATETFAADAQKVARGVGVKVHTIFVPPTTTDYAPIAAQVDQSNPASIGIILSDPVPFLNALAANGTTPKKVPMLTAVTLMPPNVLHELGSVANGMYLLTQQAPPSDTSNAGIKQMLKELKKAGFPANADNLSPASTAAWSNVHALADVLEKLPKSEIATLTSANLVSAMKNAGPIALPEVAPFNFSTFAFPDVKSLTGFRIFARDAMLVRVENGHYVSVSPFSDVTKPFKLNS